jgi:hypothetical protein
MQKKHDTYEFDIPIDDIECWERYPKHRWVYDLSRLLDAQNIKWSPYSTDLLQHKAVNIDLATARPITHQTGFIYTKKPEGLHLYSEIYITKGEIKLLRHIDPEIGTELTSLIGEVELRLSAFVTLYFTKFTGVIQVETYGNDIFGIKLRPYSDLALTTNIEIIKLTKRIYKRTDQTLSGPTDQVLHETLAT